MGAPALSLCYPSKSLEIEVVGDDELEPVAGDPGAGRAARGTARMGSAEHAIGRKAQPLPARDGKDVESAAARGRPGRGAALEQSRIDIGKPRDQAERLKLGGK